MSLFLYIIYLLKKKKKKQCYVIARESGMSRVSLCSAQTTSLGKRFQMVLSKKKKKKDSKWLHCTWSILSVGSHSPTESSTFPSLPTRLAFSTF